MLFNQMFRNIAPRQSSPPSFFTPNQPTFSPATPPEPVSGPVKPDDQKMQPPGYQIDPGMGGGGGGGFLKDLPGVAVGGPAIRLPDEAFGPDGKLNPDYFGNQFGSLFGGGQMVGGPAGKPITNPYAMTPEEMRGQTNMPGTGGNYQFFGQPGGTPPVDINQLVNTNGRGNSSPLPQPITNQPGGQQQVNGPVNPGSNNDLYDGGYMGEVGNAALMGDYWTN